MSEWCEHGIAFRCKDCRIEELEAELAYCAPYLKDGETPAERIQRERDDNCAVLKLLAQEKRRVEELQASTIHDKYVSAMKRIEELESENKLFRSTESVSDSVWDGLLAEIRGMQSRIEAGLKLADDMDEQAVMAMNEGDETNFIAYSHCAKQLREALGGSDD